MEPDVGPLVARVEGYLQAGKFVSKSLPLRTSDVTMCVDFQRGRHSSGVGVLLAVYNEDISEITSILFGRTVKYAIALENLTSVAPNGKEIPFSLYDFSEDSKVTFLQRLHTQLPAFAYEHRSLDTIARSLGSQVEARALNRFNLPEACLKLALISHVIGEDWHRFIHEGQRAGPPGFQDTLTRLQGILSERR